ncbi:MAG: S-layer homology domain-containing protein [Desulfobacterales bacterium]
MIFRKTSYVLLGICMLFLFGCGPKVMSPKAALDTPEHHVKNGHTLLDAGKIDAAGREFVRAIELGPKHAPAHTGLGLVYGHRDDFIRGLKSMATARDYAKATEEKVAVNIGYIRLYTMGQGSIAKNWLVLSEREFKAASKTAADLPGPHYYMGLAYKAAYRFNTAIERFARVLSLDKGYVSEADRQYALLQKIQRAMPGSSVGKHLALVEETTRADVAALFIQELNIEKWLKKSQQEPTDTSFESPDNTFVTSVTIKVSPATDIGNSPLKADIDAVIAMGIKGLQPYPDHTFKPEKPLTRAEFAMMMEDILIRVTGVEQLATRFIGTQSPFPDLRNDLPFFNAVMTCTTRGMMVVKDLVTGVFDPMGPVSGAEAVLGIRTLKTQF